MTIIDKIKWGRGPYHQINYKDAMFARLSSDKTQIEFLGGKFGQHSITADSSDERILAHWEGYLANNGVTA
jgi:hypothetical protein